MAQIHIDISEVDLYTFKKSVGIGNMSKVIKDFIKAYNGNADISDKSNLLEQLRIIKTKEQEVITERSQIDLKLKAIEEVELIQLRKLEAEQHEIREVNHRLAKRYFKEILQNDGVL